MLVAVHQPNLLPRLKVLQKLAFADAWVVLDDVQFARRDYQHRAHLTPDRPSQPARWCTLPVSLPSGHNTLISNVRLARSDSLTYLHSVLRHAFINGDRVDLLVAALSASVDSPSPLTALGVASTLFFLGDLAPKKVVLASTLRSDPLPRSEGLAQLCKLVNGTVYIADSGAARYLDEAALTAEGMSIVWQIWEPPPFDLPPGVLRNGSAINLWARAPAVLKRALTTGVYSRQRAEAE